MSDVRSPPHASQPFLSFSAMSFAALLGFLSAALALVPQGVAAGQTMRVASYNIRFDSMPNNITVNETLAALPDPLTAPKFFGAKGEQPWSTRRVKVYQYIDSEDAVLAGTSSWLSRVVVRSVLTNNTAQASRNLS